MKPRRQQLQLTEEDERTWAMALQGASEYAWNPAETWALYIGADRRDAELMCLIERARAAECALGLPVYRRAFVHSLMRASELRPFGVPAPFNITNFA